LQYARAGWYVLDAKNIRRRELGLPPSPSSAVRSQLLGVISDAKWRLEASFADSILPAAAHLPTYLSLAEAIRGAKLELGLATERYQLLSLNLLWTGLWTSATCLRFAPQALASAIAECNSWHRELFGQPGISLVSVPASADMPSSPWHWHFEIVKLWLRRESNPGVIGEYWFSGACVLYDALELAVAACPLLVDDQPYLDSIKRDRQWMLGASRLQNMVVV
jgi:hypothetical protein